MNNINALKTFVVRLAGNTLPALLALAAITTLQPCFSQKDLAFAAIYYADPSKGNDSNSGNISDPWKTVAASISKLKAGDTLYLRGGNYWESGITVNAKGTADSPVVIKNYPGEKPVIDGGLKEFRDAPNSDWEVVDSAMGIYRSKNTYSNVDLAFGYFESGGKYYRLVPYETYGPFSTDNCYYLSSGEFYVGPGLQWKDNKIYVRLQPGQQSIDMGFGNVPSTTNPSNLKIYVYGNNEVMLLNGAAYIEFDGVNIKHQNNALEFTGGTHHITFKNCELLGGRTHVMVRDGVHDLLFDNITMPDCVPDWIAWTDVKTDGQPAHSMQGTAFNLEGSSYNIEVKNSLIEGVFDGFDMISKAHEVHIHHNTFRGLRDDCMQIGSETYNVEIDHNSMVHVSKGPSTNGTASCPKPGSKYIHHNIIDCTQPMQYGRKMSDGTWFDQGKSTTDGGKVWARPFGAHDTSSSIVDPWKIYQNTLLFGHDLQNRGAGHCYRFAPDKSHPHEVYNNIFVQITDFTAAREAHAADGSEIHDGNLYYRPVSNASADLFKGWISGSKSSNFRSMSAFKASQFFQDSKQYYGPGFENSGIEANPLLAADYHPDPYGPAATGAVRLPSELPGNDGGTYRGALSPTSISITEPANGATVSGTVKVSANASGISGVTSVQFQMDGASLGSAESTPYAISLDTTKVIDGTHTLEAVAQDAAGSSTASSPVTIVVDNYVAPAPMSLTITAPTSGEIVSNVISIAAEVSGDASVAGIQFQLDGSDIDAEVTDSSHSLQWDTSTVPDGTYTLTAIVREDGGNFATSTPVTITVNNYSLSTLTFVPSDDATIDADSPTQNSGSTTKLEVDKKPVQSFLMKFSVTGVGSRQVSNAKLRLYCINSSDKGGDLFETSDSSWSESSITYNNAPSASGGIIASLGAVTKDNWIEVDVTSLISGEGAYGLRMTSTSTNGAGYMSKEAAEYSPQLVISFGAPNPPVVDTTPPSVAISSPTSNSTVSGTISISATASDDVGVVGVRFQLNGKDLAAEITSGSFAVSWNTTSATDGSYTLTAIARDAAGNLKTSDPVTVIVKNSPTNSATLTFTPTDDAGISSKYPTQNSGTASKLTVDHSPQETALLKFSVLGPGGQKISSAKLRLYCVNASDKGGDFHQVKDSSWSEASVTWNNAPAAESAVIASLGTVARNSWVEIDVTSMIKGDGVYSILVNTTSSNGADYDSKEVKGFAPQLVVKLN